jgi:PAS domain S-box-containing protein
VHGRDVHLVPMSSAQSESTGSFTRDMSHTGPTSSAESRTDRRFQVSQSAQLYVSGAEEGSRSARIHDISRGGMQLIVDRPVVGGPAVRIHWKGHEITGTIRYQREYGADYRIGVELSSFWEPLVYEVLSWQSEELQTSNRYLERQAAILRDQADLLDLTHDTILVTTLTGDITFWNRGAERLYGWSKPEAAGRNAHQLLQTIFPGRPEEPYQEVLAAGRWEGELVQARKDGSRIVVASRWALRRNDLDQPIGIMATNSDITRKKQAEQELLAYAAALESKNTDLEKALAIACEASTVKSRFLGSVSHEFRTPLNGIIGFSELLQDEGMGPLTAGQKECVDDLLGCSRHLLTLVNQILDLTAIEAGKMTFRYEAVSLERLVPEVIGSLRGMALGKRIQIAFDLDPDVGIVQTDPVRIKQVLYNFLSNAIKFSAEGGAVRIHVRQEGRAHYRVQVEDHGIGIAAEDQARLFAEFSQLGSSAKAQTGTGLGLAITKRIVEAQGGRVGVESALGQGSRFFAILPSQPAGSVLESESHGNRIPTSNRISAV